MRRIDRETSCIVMIALLISFGSFLVSPERAYANEDRIGVFFSNRDVERIFDAQEWSDAVEVSFRSGTGRQNLIYLKYLESARELLVLFNASDPDVTKDDLVLIAIDTGNDRSELDHNDYLFLVRPEESTAYRGSSHDWLREGYPGLRIAQKIISDGWLVFWRIPTTLNDGSAFGFVALHIDEGHESSFPLGANDMLPDSWGTLMLTRLSLQILPERVTYGDKATLEIQTHPSNSVGSITLQYAETDSPTQIWKNITMGALQKGSLSHTWSPPSAGVFNLRAIWDRDVGQPASLSLTRVLRTFRAPSEMNLTLNPNTAFADEEVNIRVKAQGVGAMKGNVTLEFKLEPSTEWRLLQNALLRDNALDFPWRSIKAPGNYTFRAIWSGDHNHLPGNVTIGLVVLPQLLEVSNLKNLLEKSARQSSQLGEVLNRTRNDLVSLTDTNRHLNQSFTQVSEKASRLENLLTSVVGERDLNVIVAVVGWAVATVATILVAVIYVRSRPSRK